MDKFHLLAKKPPTPEKMKKLESMRSQPKKLPDCPQMMKELKEVLINKQKADASEVNHQEQGLAAWSCSQVVSQQPVSHCKVMEKCHLLAKKPPTPEKMKKLESVRSQPKKLLDWPGMIKEVVSSRKLKHVTRSLSNHNIAPDMPTTITKTKVSDLREWFQEGIKNSVSKADIVQDAAAKLDEFDDIDKVRDDLQSAKQFLALELRSKEALERENKRLLARVSNLQEELKEQSSDTEQHLINKQKADHQEQGLAAWSCSQVVSQQPVSRQVSVQMFSVEHLSEEEEEEEEEDASQDIDEAMRTVKELKLKIMKLIAVRKGQTSILMELAKTQKKLKAERKKFKILHTEVDNLARLVRDDEDEVGEQKRVHRKC